MILTGSPKLTAFHHERLDGTGYRFPEDRHRLNTQERMMAYIDIYQARRKAVYKQGMPHEKPVRSCGIWRRRAGWMRAIVNRSRIAFGDKRCEGDYCGINDADIGRV